MEISGRIPDALAKIVHGLISLWKVLQVIIKIDGEHKGSPEGNIGTW